MMHNISSLYKAGVCAAALALTVGCSAHGESPTQQSNSGNNGGNFGSNVVPVTTGVVEQRAVPLEIRVIGSAEASTVVAVRAQVTGDRKSTRLNSSHLVI